LTKFELIEICCGVYLKIGDWWVIKKYSMKIEVDDAFIKWMTGIMGVDNPFYGLYPLSESGKQHFIEQKINNILKEAGN